MPVGVRNAIIILGIAALMVWWERAFAVALATMSQVISVLFVVAILAAGVAYFRRNPLAWLVMKPWQRVVVVVAALGIAFLLIAGYPLLADRITAHLRTVAERKGVRDARLEEFRWLLEELRVSLFAQELRTPQPVSVKRLDKAWAQLVS